MLYAKEGRARVGSWSPGAARAALIGVAIAVSVYAVPLSRFVFGYLAILIHEAGHSVAAWAMGYPAIPTLDLIEGGGLSIRFDRSPTLIALMLVLAWSTVLLVRRTGWLLPALAVAGLHLLVLIAPFHEAVIVAAGHGAELLAAGLLFRRGLLGDARGAEQVASFAAAVFVLLVNADLAVRLMFDSGTLGRYVSDRKGDVAMDLVRFGEAFGWSVDALAALLLLAALLVAPAAAVSARLRDV
ncbi:MAG TPA: hypothetical protein VMV46_13270 [Thermoanaerobaculia bacterium]|nr:hypothetical protein [Thermoanaerobaculia bacterium]